MDTPKTKVDIFLDSVKETFYGKLGDYGLKDLEEVGMVGVASRLRDKIARIENLASKPPMHRPQYEALGDTWLDVAGYALCGWLLYKGWWTEGELNGTRQQSIHDIQVKKMDEDGELNKPSKHGDVGYDIIVSADTEIPPLPSMPVTIPGGVSIKIPDGYFCQIVGRSSSANKKGLLIHTATIDNGYTGRLFACASNLTDKPVTVKKGERVAQVVFFPMSIFDTQEVEELPVTSRADSGFGSTGK